MHYIVKLFFGFTFCFVWHPSFAQGLAKPEVWRIYPNRSAKAIKPQGPNKEELSFGFMLQSTQPTHKYKREQKNLLWGFNFYVDYRIKERPFSFGLDVGWSGNGRSSTNQSILVQTINAGVIIDEYQVPLNVVAHNGITHGMLHARITASRSLIRPYFDLLFGLHYFATRVKIYEEGNEFYFKDDQNDDGLISNNLLESSIALGAGGRVGLLIKLMPHIYLNASAANYQGSKARYYTAPDLDSWDIVIDSQFDANDKLNEQDLNINSVAKRAPISAWLFQMGIVFSSNDF
ncbi:MAG: hypothetical protein RIQ89_624 [Bacteroidota bacterium]|jgi:hypothetical protein